jgi:arylsulfatase A-like enzyme
MQQASDLPFGDFTDDPIARTASEFLGREHKAPFFLAVSLHNPHDICYWVMNKLPPGHPSRAELDVEERLLPPLPRNHHRSANEPEFIRICRERRYYGEENTYTKEWDELRWRRYLYGYYRMTERVDKAAGTVLAALRDTGRDRDTIVVFTSDHGEGMAAHQWVVKLMLWQEVVSVPLIWRWPDRIPAGKENRTALASGIDVVPTLCDLAGIPISAGMHGASLSRALSGRSAGGRSSLFAQLAPDTKDETMQGRAVRSRQYKYVRFSKGANPEMLFDIEHDPGEARNLVADKAHSRELDRHRTLLQEWVSRSADPFLRT